MISISTASSCSTYSGKLSCHRLIFKPVEVWDLSQVNPTFFLSVLSSRGPLGEQIPAHSQHIPNKTSRSLQNPFGAARDQAVTIHSQESDLHVVIGVMDTGKLGCAGSIPAFSRKRDLLKELEFPSSINILHVTAEKAQILQEEGGFLEHNQCSCRDLGFCIQNDPVPTKNRERKHSQRICSWVLAWAASAVSRNQTALLRWNLFGKRMTKSGYSHPEF